MARGTQTEETHHEQKDCMMRERKREALHFIICASDNGWSYHTDSVLVDGEETPFETIFQHTSICDLQRIIRTIQNV